MYLPVCACGVRGAGVRAEKQTETRLEAPLKYGLQLIGLKSVAGNFLPLPERYQSCGHIFVGINVVG